jgi:xylulokinase/erythritol kinase
MSSIGLDVGTSMVKAVRFDEDYQAVDSTDEPTTVIRGPDGAREQDMHEVWAAAARVLAAIASRCPDSVDLVAVTAQGDGCWLVDGHQRPVGNALLWNDNRAAGVLQDWQDDGTLERSFRISGSLGAPGSSHAQLRWLRQHEPDRLDRATCMLTCGGWIYARLTDRLVVDNSEAANPFCDAVTGAYDPRLVDLFGLQADAALLPPIVTGTDRVAPLSSSVAKQLGLPEGTPVVLAPYDVVTTAIGAGAVEVGAGFAVLGTTLCIGATDDQPRLERPPNGMTLPLGDDGRWLIAYATMTGTETLHWAAQLLGLADVQALGALAATATRPDPPLLLPYLSLSGERSPFLDSQVRGSLLRLDLMHTPADIAHGVFDGLTLAVLDCVRAAGRPTSLALSGGGARSDQWSQAICDATGVPVTRPDTPEIGARGAVLSAAVATGVFSDLREAASAAVRPGPVLHPCLERTNWFDQRYTDFVASRGVAAGQHRGRAAAIG